MYTKDPRPEKVEKVAQIAAHLSQCGGVILTNHRGLTVHEITQLRSALRDSGAEYHVVKNTLLRRALGETPDSLAALLHGPTAIAICHQSPIEPAKALIGYFRELRKPEVVIKGAWIGGTVYDVEQVTALSKLPPRPVILGQVLGTIQAPLTNLAGTLNGVLSEFARTLQALADQRSSQTV